MGYPDYKRDLVNPSVDVNYILDKYFHSGQSAVFVGAAPDDEPRLKNEVATALYGTFKIRVHPLQLIICGSAHLGFSPVPAKLGTPFDPESTDIDIAVISPDLFEAWWTELQTLGLDKDTRFVVSRDLFWGFMNPANLHDVSENGQKWWQTFGALRTDRARGVRGRLYKNFWSMQSYHRQAIMQARSQLLTESEGGPSPAASGTVG